MPGPAVPFPQDVAVVAMNATWEGPSSGARRFYVDENGTFTVEDLIVSIYEEGRERALVGLEVGPNGEFAAAFCHGWCYGTSLPVTVRRSEDGGITWNDVVTIEEGGWGSLLGVDAESVLARKWETPNDYDVVRIDGETTEPIGPSLGLPADVHFFPRFVDGEVRLAAAAFGGEAVWDYETGSTLFELPAPPAGTHVSHRGFTYAGGNERYAFDWYPQTTGVQRGYMGLIDGATGAVKSMYEWRREDGLGDFHLAGWLSPTVAIARAEFRTADYIASPAGPEEFGTTPAIVDFEARTVSPISEFVPALLGKAGGPVPYQVLVGPFARVEPGSGCLNVRSQPNTEAEVLACYTTGVLLRIRDDDGGSNDGWTPVMTPLGVDGWASSEYLRLP